MIELPRHHLPHDRVVHAFDRDHGDVVPTAGQEKVAVIGTERRIDHDRETRKAAPELGQLGEEGGRRGEHDGIDQPGVEHPAERGGPRQVTTPAPAPRQGAPQGEHGRPALEQRDDGGH